MEHSQGVSHINPDGKASHSMEDFTTDQDWSFGEPIAHLKENVCRASQISTHITVEAFAHLVEAFF